MKNPNWGHRLLDLRHPPQFREGYGVHGYVNFSDMAHHHVGIMGYSEYITYGMIHYIV